MSTYRISPASPAEERAPCRSFGVDVMAAAIAVALGATEVSLQLLHGGAWGAEPTLALAIALVGAWSLVRESCARWRSAHAVQAEPQPSTRWGGDHG
ncbi:MAG TPA: hypothetical protein VL400_13795 [Polyangiaceae bacterium]|jgi:hypothetical protein|nr:hypothetical protein [Polyangiaceae bacterium]